MNNKFIDFRKQKPDKSGVYLVITGDMKDDSIFTMTFELDMDDGEQWGYWEQYFSADTLGWLGDDWKPWQGEPVVGWMPIPDYSELEDYESDD